MKAGKPTDDSPAADLDVVTADLSLIHVQILFGLVIVKITTSKVLIGTSPCCSLKMDRQILNNSVFFIFQIYFVILQAKISPESKQRSSI